MRLWKICLSIVVDRVILAEVRVIVAARSFCEYYSGAPLSFLYLSLISLGLAWAYKLHCIQDWALSEPRRWLQLNLELAQKSSEFVSSCRQLQRLSIHWSVSSSKQSSVTIFRAPKNRWADWFFVHHTFLFLVLIMVWISSFAGCLEWGCEG